MPLRLPQFLVLAALLGLTACNSFESRAKEKTAVYATLDEATKARLKTKEIRVGDSADMVYIALGKPDEKTESISASGRSGRWIYSAYWQEYQGTRLVGYRRDVIYNPTTKSYSVSYTPDYQPIYTPRVEDRIRITFVGGRVTVVEQAHPSATPENSAVK